MIEIKPATVNEVSLVAKLEVQMWDTQMILPLLFCSVWI